MLINIRISELQSNTSNSIALAIIVGILFNYSLFEVLPYDITILNNYNITLNIFYIFLLFYLLLGKPLLLNFISNNLIN